MAPGDLLAHRYRLTRLIGEGAMGVVWAAQHERTAAPVAVKLIRPAGGTSAELRDRLLREARACGRIRHRNVVEIHDAGETDAGDAFLVMELLEGEPLADLLARQPTLAPRLAAAIGAQIADGLAAAHAAGVVHRDLKPDNVFLRRDAERAVPAVVLLDFGVSKVLSADAKSTATGSVFGSPAYMSPEQARASKTADHRTDLWSLGVVLFEALAGRRPFEADTAFAVVAEILTSPVPSLADADPSIDPRLSALVARCLDRDPARRPASADEVARELRAIAASLEGAPEPARATPAPEPTPRAGEAATRSSPDATPAPSATGSWPRPSTPPSATPPPVSQRAPGVTTTGPLTQSGHAWPAPPSAPAIVAPPVAPRVARPGAVAAVAVIGGLGAAAAIVAGWMLLTPAVPAAPQEPASAPPIASASASPPASPPPIASASASPPASASEPPPPLEPAPTAPPEPSVAPAEVVPDAGPVPSASGAAGPAAGDAGGARPPPARSVKPPERRLPRDPG
jgi:serine/threonine-protein kinase